MLDYYEQVKLKEEENAQLYKRMTTDRDLYYLSKYVLSDKSGRAIPDIINVTLNRPKVYADDIFANFTATTEQAVVESSRSTVDTDYIEDYLDAAFNSANIWLQDRGQRTLNNFTDIQLCLRGRGARCVLWRMENGKLIKDTRNWDTRYVTYQRGETGLEWGAYHMNRSWQRAVDQYGELMIKYGIMKEGDKKTNADIIDIYTKDHNELWIEGKQVKEQRLPDNITECPVIVASVPLGYGDVLLEEGSVQYEGESIYASIRDIVPELNRLVSILQTLNQKQLLTSMQYKNPDGSPQDEPPDMPKSGDMVSVGKGELALIDYGDARRAAEMLYNILDKNLQHGSITDIDLGNLNFPLSAVAIVTVGEGRDRIYLPRLRAKGLINQKTAEMITKQILQTGETSVELGTKGHTKSFKTSKLDDEYEITYKYFVKSPKLDIARLTMGQTALSMGIDRLTVYKDIMQYEDPEGMINKYYYEQAGLVSPMVQRNRIITSLLEMAEKDGDEKAARDAQLMAAELSAAIDQMSMGVEESKQEKLEDQSETPSVGEPILPLMGQGGATGGTGPMTPGGLP